MGLCPQFSHDSQALPRRQAHIGERIRLIGVVEIVEDADFFLHRFIVSRPCFVRSAAESSKLNEPIKCPFPPATNSGPTKSWSPSARVAWEPSTEPAIRGSDATSPSRFLATLRRTLRARSVRHLLFKSPEYLHPLWRRRQLSGDENWSRDRRSRTGSSRDRSAGGGPPQRTFVLPERCSRFPHPPQGGSIPLSHCSHTT